MDVPAVVVLTSLGLFLVLYLNIICAEMFLAKRSNYNSAIAATYFFGLLTSCGKVSFAFFPNVFPRAQTLGEIALVLAVGLNESLALHRFIILSGHKFKMSIWVKAVFLLLLWSSGVYRIIMQIINDTTDPLTVKIDTLYNAATVTFYSFVAFMDITLSSVSLKYLYDIKKNIIVGRLSPNHVAVVQSSPSREKSNLSNHNKSKVSVTSSHERTSGLILIRRVQIIICGEIMAALTGLITYTTLQEYPTTASCATDLSIFMAGYAAILYSKHILKIAALKPNRKELENSVASASKKVQIMSEI